MRPRLARLFRRAADRLDPPAAPRLFGVRADPYTTSGTTGGVKIIWR